jgi:Ca2+/Na+ antiporter
MSSTAPRIEHSQIMSQSSLTALFDPQQHTARTRLCCFALDIRQKINILLILFLILVTFASYHEGSTLWLQWLTVLTIFVYLLFFDMAFTNDSQFIFDPDAENWRRKTVRTHMLCHV